MSESNTLISKFLSPLKKFWAGSARFIGADFQTTLPVRSAKRAMYSFDFEADGQRSLRLIIWLQRIIIVLLLSILPFYLGVHKIENRYFGTTDEGRIIPNTPLDAPNIGTPSLVSWVAQATTDSLNMSFHDYNRRLRNASVHFTRKGWSQFTQFLNDQRFFNRLKRGRALIRTQPAIAPILQDQGVFIDAKGQRRYYWRLKLSLQTEYIAASPERRTYEMFVNVIRVPKLENGKGISIDEWTVIDVD